MEEQEKKKKKKKKKINLDLKQWNRTHTYTFYYVLVWDELINQNRYIPFIKLNQEVVSFRARKKLDQKGDISITTEDEVLNNKLEKGNLGNTRQNPHNDWKLIKNF